MYPFCLYLKSKDRPVASLSYPVPHHVIQLIIPIKETNLAIACVVIVWFVGGPAIADRSYQLQLGLLHLEYYQAM